jgi:apolipoprotein N-acyltransferase
MTFGPKQKILLLAPLGALMALAMPPFGFWPLLFAGLGGFYLVVRNLTGRAAFAAGWLFGFGYFAAGLYWIGNALLVPGNDFKWVWPLAILGLPVGLALFTGAAAWIAVRYAREGVRGVLFFIGVMALCEWVRGTIFTGFPWNLYAYGWATLPAVAQSVSWAGAYGLTLITLGLTVFATYGAARRSIPVLAGTLVALGVLYGWGAVRLDTHPTHYNDTIIVRIVQPNIAQEDKWRGDRVAQNLRNTVETSVMRDFIAGKTYAIIWPETAITQFVAEDQNVRAYIRDTLFDTEDNRFLLTGLLRHETKDTGKAAYYNSLVAYNRDLVPMATYDKAHLVPFGEYIPFQDIIPLAPFAAFSGFTPGPGLRTEKILGLPPFGGLVCYEIIFPGAAVAKGDETRPEWIINVTNDGWYGDSPGPYQHLTKARFRAIEEGIPVIRSANTGISAVIDPTGRILYSLPYGRAGVIDSPLPVPLTKPTIFSRFGNIPFLMLCTIFISLGIRLRKN